MQKGIIKNKPLILINESYEGESIERKMERAMTTNEPIENTAPMTYTERKDGVHAEHDIRTDRWNVALDAIDKAQRSNMAMREEHAAPAAAPGVDATMLDV